MCIGGWLYQKKFRELIEQIVDGNAIQYLSTKLIDTKNNEENTEYRIANLLDVVDALDLEHSQYDLFELDNEKNYFSRKICFERRNGVGARYI